MNQDPVANEIRFGAVIRAADACDSIVDKVSAFSAIKRFSSQLAIYGQLTRSIICFRSTASSSLARISKPLISIV